MEFLPFFRRPYYYQDRYGRIPYGTYNVQSNSKQEQEYNRQMYQKQEQAKVKEKLKQSEANNRLSEEEPIFEIFGIKLHFDDILIIALIFFLYNEGVKDNYLFISLILLLLS